MKRFTLMAFLLVTIIGVVGCGKTNLDESYVEGGHLL